MAVTPGLFSVDVPRIGTFMFRKRTMRLEIAIQAEYSRLTEGVLTPTIWLDTVCTWIANLKLLTAQAPPGWENLDEIDPTEDDVYQRLKEVSDALAAKEAEFRRAKASPGQGQGQGRGAESGVPVQAAVQHAADGPQVP